MSDDLTTRVQQWQSVRAACLIPEQWVTDAIVNDLLEKVQELEREVARLREERDKWLDAFNRSEQFQNGPTKRAEAAEASLATLRGLVAKWHNYPKAVEQEQTPEFYRGLRHCADELAALFPTNDTPKEPA